MADRQDQHGILRLIMVVQREIAGNAAGDFQFPQIVLCRSPNQRVVVEYPYRFSNQPNGCQRRSRLCVEQEIDQTLKIG